MFQSCLKGIKRCLKISKQAEGIVKNYRQRTYQNIEHEVRFFTKLFECLMKVNPDRGGYV